MSRFDDRLTRELERAARPVEPAGALEEIDRRRGRRVVVRRAQTGLLAAVVFAVSIGGVAVLNRAFRGDVGVGTATDKPEPTTTVPEPTTTPTSDQVGGQDIGLGFNLCNLESLSGIDFLGDGANGTAWVGTRLATDGSCPSSYEGRSIVAADVDGDGSAESWAGPLAPCYVCRPFDTTDLNADGVLELVVWLQSDVFAEYRVFSLQPVPGDGPPELRQSTVAEPGLLPDFRPGKPVSLWAGGDAGVGDYISCEGYPAHPVLIFTESVSVIDGPKSSQVTVVRLALRADGTMEVIGSDSYTDPGTNDAPDYAFTGSACGVEFRPEA